jgi:hypothetical protein
MNGRAQGELAIGLLGVWTMIQALSLLLNTAGVMLAMDQRAASSPYLVAIAVPAAAMLVVGYLMVRHHAVLVSFVFPGIGTVAERESLDLPVVLVGCVGLWIIGNAVPGLIRTMLMYATPARMGPSATRALDQRAVIAYLVQTAFGLLLVLRPRRMTSLWRA